MINAWWIAPAILVGAIIGYFTACFMYIVKISGDNANEKIDKK